MQKLKSQENIHLPFLRFKDTEYKPKFDWPLYHLDNYGTFKEERTLNIDTSEQVSIQTESKEVKEEN
jgi:hypothetical protein